MPINPETLKKANAAMRENTNRAILFTTVNLSPDAPRLSDMLADLQAGLYSWEQFRALVKERLTVTSFAEFLEKFRPCFYYRLKPLEEPIEPEAVTSDADTLAEEPAVASSEESEDIGDTDDAEGTDLLEEPVEEAEPVEPEESGDELVMASQLPEYEFSLTGGPPELGWHRVDITMNHPLLKNLAMHIQERALSAGTTAQVNVTDALWGFAPRSQQLLMRKATQDLRAAMQVLMKEMQADPDSPDTKRALEAYDRRLDELEQAVGDDLRVLPAITHGLAEARRALGQGGGAAGAGPALGAFALELGEGGRAVTRRLDPAQTLRALGSGGADVKALEAGTPSESREIVPLKTAVERYAPLQERKAADIVKLPEKERYPALVGSFMSEMVRLNKIQPAMGNMLAVVLQDPKQLATWNVNPREVEVFHDTFLGIYSIAVERFFRAVVPLFETIMGVWALFNEFPADVRKGRPELIVANDELTDLWQVYGVELATFFRSSCHQATNQYRDAISFAIVPSVSPLLRQVPLVPPAVEIRAGDFIEDYHRQPSSARPDETAEAMSNRLKTEFDALRKKQAGIGGGFGRVTGAGEVLGLMQLGKECGFAVFMSPEERIIAGKVRPEDVGALQEKYCPDNVVERDWAVSGVVCVPDFVCLPAGGVLVIGTVMDGRRVGVDVPQLVVRSCYVAAGRYMANDNPNVLSASIRQLPEDMKRTMSLRVRQELPGIAVDLVKYPMLGRTCLAPDHFLSDHVIRTLLERDQSFLVFGHVTGQPPHIAAQRTLRRVQDRTGTRYMLLHHWRQQVYLQRLFYAAYHMGYGGAWPTFEEMQELMNQITRFMKWYDADNQGFVNAFPSALENDTIDVEPVMDGDQIISFKLNMNFKAAVSSPIEISVA